MSSGMTAGKFGAYLVAVALMVIGGVAVGYDEQLIGWILIVGGGWLGIWISIDVIWDRHNDEIQYRSYLAESRTKFAQALTQVDSETRQFLSIEWPELGVEFGIEPIFYLLDNGMNTDILLECFRKFLLDSSENEFADVRKYNDDKYLQTQLNMSREKVRSQWTLATQFLLRKEYLMHDSMRGSHSYQWKSKGHYRKLARQYVRARAVSEIGSGQLEASA
jgi:hypothetical protein